MEKVKTTAKAKADNESDCRRSAKSLFFQQLLIFIVLYFANSSIHIIRTGWSTLKSEVKSEFSLQVSTLGLIDSLFLLSYASGLIINGQLGDRFPRKIIVFLGLSFSSICICALALSGARKIYTFYDTVFLFIVMGYAQSAVSPCMSAILSQWIPPNRQGILLGLWSSNSGTGSIISSQLIISLNRRFAWEWYNNLLICGIIGLFCSVSAAMLNIENPPYQKKIVQSNKSESISKQNLSISQVIRFHRVIFHAAIAFCLKLSHYGFLFWLPYFTKNSLKCSETTGMMILVLYNMGFLAGSFLTGFFSDLVKSRYLILTLGLLFATILTICNLFCLQYEQLMLLIAPLLALSIGGSQILLTTSCTVDLGKAIEEKTGKKTLSTILGLVDGCGSLGGAFGQLLIGFLASIGWGAVFGSFTVAVSLAGVCSAVLFFGKFDKQIAVSKN